LEDQEYKTDNFKETVWKQASDIVAHGERIGTVEVCYLGQKPEIDEGPFMKEERDLIDALARRLARLTEQNETKESLRKSEYKNRTLLENLPQKIFFKDRNSVYLSCNENYARDLMIESEEITENTDYDFFPKGLAEKYRADDQRIMESGKIEDIEGLAEKYRADDQRIMESGKTEDIEDTYIQEGQEVVVHTVKTPIKDGQGNVIGILGIFWDITGRKQAEEQIKVSLEEKEVLLYEINHRVKNNMQVISSLLGLQVNSAEDEGVINALMEFKGRIQIMAVVHEMLHDSDSLSLIDFRAYISSLASNIFHSYSTSTGRVKLKVDVEDIKIGVKQATPLGLIANELITNSIKYAFPENRSGEIVIGLRTREQNGIKFVISDNGIGIPEDLDWRNTDSLGLKLVTTVAENQLDGTVSLDREKGTRFTIKISLEETK
jgi:two-component sensor histidine kinase/PAS domain-containing protein